jgi:hypothetical protein
LEKNESLAVVVRADATEGTPVMLMQESPNAASIADLVPRLVRRLAFGWHLILSPYATSAYPTAARPPPVPTRQSFQIP